MAVIKNDCTYSNPVRYDGSVPTLPTHAFYFKNSECNVTGGATSSPMAVGYNPSTTIASSTDIQVYGSITSGELIISFLVFMLIVIQLGKIIASGLEKINTKQKYIRYSGGDVEVTDDVI